MTRAQGWRVALLTLAVSSLLASCRSSKKEEELSSKQVERQRTAWEQSLEELEQSQLRIKRVVEVNKEKE